MDAPELDQAIEQNQYLLQQATVISEKFGVNALPKIRIDDDVALAISRASREEKANLIVMGWSSNKSLRALLFGNLIDSVFWSSHCPVAVTRLLISPSQIRQILVPIDGLTEKAWRIIRFAQVLATMNQSSLSVFHVFPRHVPGTQIEQFKSHLSDFITQENSGVRPIIKTVTNDNVATAIIQEAKLYDLIVLNTVRHRTTAGLVVSDITTQVIRELSCSLVLFGEPH